MTRDDIEATEWARTLYVNETADSYFNIIERLVHGVPVFIAWMGDSAEITLGSYTIHSTPTMEDAITWCQQFELPVHTQASSDIVPKLLEWLDAECNDPAASWAVKTIMSVVREKIYELMGGAKQ